MIPYYEFIAEQTEFLVGSDNVTYEYFVTRLIKEMGSLDNNITHMALGIAGEAGEVVDAIKKRVIYDKLLDRDNVIEELGDLEFYMAGLRQMLNISRAVTLTSNIAKLQVRYAGSYSDAAASARADKEAAVQAALADHTPGQAINVEAAVGEKADSATTLVAAVPVSTAGLLGLPAAVDPLLVLPDPSSPAVAPLP